MSKTKKGDPIPAKFDEPEESLILNLNIDTGLSQSEIIRRAVRLLRLEMAKRGSDAITFLIRELGPRQGVIADEPSSPYEKRVMHETLSPKQIEKQTQPRVKYGPQKKARPKK